MQKIKPPQTVEEYLERVPEPARSSLEKIRAAIKAAAPMAEEKIAYQMPAYMYNGPIAYFAAFKNHCSYFPAGYAVIEAFKAELGKYEIDKGTIRFPHHKPLPATLVKKMVKAKLEENAARLEKKKRKPK